MVNFTRTLEIAGTSGFVQPIKLVQYDATLPVGVFELVENGQPFDIPAGTKAKVRLRKADGKGVYNDATVSGDTVQVVFTQQMTAAFGVGFLNIELIYDGGVKSSEPVQVVVLENAVQQGAIESSDEFLTLGEIVKQVETLRQQTATDAASAAASKTAAASSATAAQSARAGAEAAESRVNSIVAGNESYTKRQIRDMFALALKATAEKAANLEIYPDEGSNVAVTSYGFTEQAGTGDPSPTNVRQLMVGGLQANLLKQIPDASGLSGGIAWAVKNGVISFSGTPQGPTLGTFALKIPCDIPAGKYTAVANQSVIGNWVQDYFDESQNRIIRLDKSYVVKTFSFELERDAKYVTLQFYVGGGNIGTYVSDSYVTALYKGLNSKTPAIPNQNGVEYGTVVQTKGTSEINKLIPLTAPLCEGDTVQTWVKSGCDKVIVLDGTTNRVVDGGTYWFNYASSDVLAGATMYGDYVSTNDMQAVLHYIQFRKTAVAQYGTTAEALNEYFASHPLTVWYRSTNYTDADDIAVSLETHVRYRRILDGTEEYYEYRKEDNTDKYFGFAVALRPYTPSADWGNGISSHFKFGSASSPGYYPNSFVTHSNGDLYIRTEIEGVISPETMKEYAKSRFDAGSPMTFVYKLAAPITYAHDPVYLDAYPDGNGKFTVSGEKLVSARYNKSLNKEFEEFKSAVLAMGAQLSL